MESPGLKECPFIIKESAEELEKGRGQLAARST
jgi:hypothetical protein